MAEGVMFDHESTLEYQTAMELHTSALELVPPGSRFRTVREQVERATLRVVVVLCQRTNRGLTGARAVHAKVRDCAMKAVGLLASLWRRQEIDAAPYGRVRVLISKLLGLFGVEAPSSDPATSAPRESFPAPTDEATPVDKHSEVPLAPELSPALLGESDEPAAVDRRTPEAGPSPDSGLWCVSQGETRRARSTSVWLC